MSDHENYRNEIKAYIVRGWHDHERGSGGFG